MHTHNSVFPLKGERGRSPPFNLSPPPFHQANNYKGQSIDSSESVLAHLDYEWSMYMHQAP